MPGAGDIRAGRAAVEVTADDKGLKTTLARASNSLKGFAGVVSALGAGVAAKEFLGDAIKAASDFGEQFAATGQVFKGSSKVVTDAVDDMAARFGTVKTEALTAANSLGGIFKASGFNEAEAAKMSVEFTRLADDLASFKNLSFEEALQKIRAGLVGEAEPLRTVGVLLSAAAVEQEAYTSGIAKMGSELTEAQKVQARARIITKQLADAQGDHARTMDSVANRLKKFQGDWQNSMIAMGKALEPVTLGTLDFLDGINKLLPAVADFAAGAVSLLGEVGKAAREIVASVGEIGGALDQLLPKIHGNKALIALLTGGGLAGIAGLGGIAEGANAQPQWHGAPGEGAINGAVGAILKALERAAGQANLDRAFGAAKAADVGGTKGIAKSKTIEAAEDLGAALRLVLERERDEALKASEQVGGAFAGLLTGAQERGGFFRDLLTGGVTGGASADLEEQVKDGTEKASRKIEARGSFSAAAASGLGIGDTVADRVAEASERAAKELEELNRRARAGRLVFLN